jgi:pilus assembly protein CpaF
LRLIQRHTLYLEAKHADRAGRGGLNVRELFVNSLRMRPDRIIVGEVRGGEALDLIQSMISGHSGSLSTIHADTPLDALIRLETLSLMSDVQIPVYVARAQVASAINLVVQIARFTEDGSRKLTRVAEVIGLDDNNRYQTCDLFVSKPGGKTSEGRLIANLVATGQRPSFSREPYEQGIGELIRLTGGVWER